MPHDDIIDAVLDESLQEGKPWRHKLQVGSCGQTLSNLANILLPLRFSDTWRGVIAYDEMRQAIIAQKPLPVEEMMVRPEGDDYPRLWRHSDDLHVQEWLQRTDFHRVGLEAVSNAVSAIAWENRFHPVRDHLDRLRHDGIPRIQGGTTPAGDTVEPWLSRYLGVADTPYSRAAGRVWLLSMIARVRQPGCKSDLMPVLEGPQGAGKSTACRILGGAWFSDALPDIRSGKDAEAHLAGKWLVEISELEAMDKASAAAMKGFISRQVGRFRPAYERREVEQPRQCIFVGSTNEAAYLRDPTGGRRFLPLKVAEIDALALEDDRDQLLAEADALYKAGEPWHLTETLEIKAATEEQEARFEADPWEERVSCYLRSCSHVTVTEIMEHALEIETSRQDRRTQLRVMNIMTNLGWCRGNRGTGGKRLWRPQRLVTE